jgi:hypothetical protein
MYQLSDEFLTDDEQQRINQQQYFEDLYLGKHVYDKTISVVDDKNQVKNVKVNQLLPLPQTISETWSDLLFLEFPQITFKDDNADELVKEIEKKLQIDLLEAGASNSAIGMLWWMLFMVDGEVHWKFVQPQKTIWRRDELGRLIDLKLFKDITPDKEKSDKIYKIIEHSYAVNDDNEIIEKSDGARVHVINTYIITVSSDNKIIALKEISSEPTGLAFIPAIEVSNMAMLGCDEGRSDYDGKNRSI